MKKRLEMEILCSLSRSFRAPLALLKEDLGCSTQGEVQESIGRLRELGYKIATGNDDVPEGQQGCRVAWIEGDGVAEATAAKAYWETVNA